MSDHQKSSCFLSERKASRHAEFAISPTVNHHPFSKLQSFSQTPIPLSQLVKIAGLLNRCHVSNMFSIMMHIVVSSTVNITTLSQVWEAPAGTTLNAGVLACSPDVEIMCSFNGVLQPFNINDYGWQ